MLRCSRFSLPLDHPLIMGIINVPPDSFSDGGAFLSVSEAIEHGQRLIEENRDKVETMAKALLEWETIDSEQVNDIMEGRAPRPPKPTQPPAAKPPQDSSPSAPAPTTTKPAQET